MQNNKKRNIFLEIDNIKFDLPILSGSNGPDVIDIKNLYKLSNLLFFFT